MYTVTAHETGELLIGLGPVVIKLEEVHVNPDY